MKKEGIVIGVEVDLEHDFFSVGKNDLKNFLEENNIEYEEISIDEWFFYLNTNRIDTENKYWFPIYSK